MARFFSEIAFNGSAYHGWQIQPNAITVQALMNDCFQKLIGDRNINTMGCGRTDTGVHAKQFFLHFETDFQIQEDLARRANGFLPEDIVVKSVWEVPSDFHARFSAISRTYEYHINQNKDPFKIGHSWYFSKQIDIIKINNQLESLIGEHDFTSFSKNNTQAHTNICTVTEAKWRSDQDQLIFKITANRFLRNMVRAVVGTCIDFVKDTSHQGIEHVLTSKSRSEAGVSVPAHGLYLAEVNYPKSHNE